jgi:hypothetical protein
MNAHARAKEVANKKKELELALLTKEVKIMSIPITDDMDPIQRAWLELRVNTKSQQMQCGNANCRGQNFPADPPLLP